MKHLTGRTALVAGAQAYVSPAWYGGKRLTGKVVPTWNYAIVETKKTSPGSVGVGTAYRQIRSIPDTSEEGFEVTAFEPPAIVS